MAFNPILRRGSMLAIATAALAAVGPRVARAQQALASATDSVPQVGQLAPDFSLPGATRYGVLRDPVRLADFRGQTVVLAFFIRARTKG